MVVPQSRDQLALLEGSIAFLLELLGLLEVGLGGPLGGCL